MTPLDSVSNARKKINKQKKFKILPNNCHRSYFSKKKESKKEILIEFTGKKAKKKVYLRA